MLLAVGLVQAGRRLVAVERAGHNVGVDDQTAVLDVRHLLVVKIDLDVAVTQREGLAVRVVADGVRVDLAGFHRQQLRADLLHDALRVDEIIAGDKVDLDHTLDPGVEDERRVILIIFRRPLRDRLREDLFVDGDRAVRLQVEDGGQIVARKRLLAVRQEFGILVEIDLNLQLRQRGAEEAVGRIAERRSRDGGGFVAVDRGQLERCVLRAGRRHGQTSRCGLQPLLHGGGIQLVARDLFVHGIDAVHQVDIGVLRRRALHALQIGQHGRKIQLTKIRRNGRRRLEPQLCPVQPVLQRQSGKLRVRHAVKLGELCIHLLQQIVAQTERLHVIAPDGRAVLGHGQCDLIRGRRHGLIFGIDGLMRLLRLVQPRLQPEPYARGSCREHHNYNDDHPKGAMLLHVSPPLTSARMRAVSLAKIIADSAANSTRFAPRAIFFFLRRKPGPAALRGPVRYLRLLSG